MNIQETFGIPSNNSSLGLGDIINAVISKFHPKPPEKSTITGRDFSVIDPSNKPISFVFDGNAANVLFSNILFVNEQDYEKLGDTVLGTRVVSSSYIKAEILYIIGEDGYFDDFNTRNKQETFKILNDYENTVAMSKWNILDLFIKANQTVKGLKSIQIDNNFITLSLTNTDILKRIMR